MPSGESNPRVRHGEAVGCRYIMGTHAEDELSKRASGTGGARTLTTRLRAGRAAASTSIPSIQFIRDESAREESNLRLAVIGRGFSRCRRWPARGAAREGVEPLLAALKGRCPAARRPGRLRLAGRRYQRRGPVSSVTPGPTNLDGGAARGRASGLSGAASRAGPPVDRRGYRLPRRSCRRPFQPGRMVSSIRSCGVVGRRSCRGRRPGPTPLGRRSVVGMFPRRFANCFLWLPRRRWIRGATRVEMMKGKRLA